MFSWFQKFKLGRNPKLQVNPTDTVEIIFTHQVEDLDSFDLSTSEVGIFLSVSVSVY